MMSWDTEFWGLPVANATSPDALGQWAIENAVGCVCLLIPAADIADVHRAEQHGAQIMDVRVTLEHRDLVAAPAAVRPILPADVESLVAIARTAFRGLTRFYADPNFADERCDDLYEAWFRKACAEDIVLMIGDGEPAGFITVHKDGETASIGLIAVAERIRGRGFGLALTQGALDFATRLGAKQMTVVTQGRNLAAQRTFQRAGFLTSQIDLWLHRWYT